jgi:hypothetical protein
MSRTRLICRGIATCIVPCIAVLPLLPAAAAAVPDSHLPPPGLYRVDSEGNSTTLNGRGPSITVQQQADGASGNERYQALRAGAGQVARDYVGERNTTFCMPVSGRGAGLPLPNGGSCRSGPGVAGKDGTTFVLHCQGLDMTTVVRKLDARTWEVRFEGQQSAPVVGSVDDGMAQMKRVLEYAAKNGPAADRAEALRELAALDARGAELKQALTNLKAPPGGAGGVGATLQGVQRLTRIADRCEAGAQR